MDKSKVTLIGDGTVIVENKGGTTFTGKIEQMSNTELINFRDMIKVIEDKATEEIELRNLDGVNYYE